MIEHFWVNYPFAISKNCTLEKWRLMLLLVDLQCTSKYRLPNVLKYAYELLVTVIKAVTL